MNTLEQAAELLEQGWCKSNLIQDGKVCALGAIAKTELNVDTRLLDHEGLKYDDFTQEERVERYKYESNVYDELKELASTKVLAAEIMASEWYDAYRATWVDEDGSRFYTSNEEFDAQWSEDATELVYTFNDEQKNEYPVIEMFKLAAKRMDAK